MQSKLHIPRLALGYNENREQCERHERHERKERREHHSDSESDPLSKLPGQMLNIAGAAVIGSVALGFLGGMSK